MTDNRTIVSAFTEDQVATLTGLTKRRLRYWDRTNFFKPSMGFENRRVAFSRIYSFRDVVALRTLAQLRLEHRVSLQHLRQVADELSHVEDRLWTSIVLYVLKNRVHVHNENTGNIEDVITRQQAIGIPLKAVEQDTRTAVERLKKRSASDYGRVSRSRNLSHNSWVISGTRVPVAAIKRFSESGYSIEQIQCEYPSLTPHDIRAAIEHHCGNAVA